MYANAAMQLLGITLIAAAAVFDLMNSPAVVLGGVNAIWTLRSIVTVAFGVYAGLKLQVVVSFLRPGRHSVHWAGLHTAGFLTGAAVAVIVILVPRLVDLPCLGDCAPFYMPSLTTEYIVNMIVTYVFGTWLLFISGVLLGNVIQVKAEQERWGIPGEAPSGGGQRRAAILALVGVIGAALLQSVGQIIAALVGNP